MTAEHSITMESRHPIRVVTERTGLSPDVLRAWERRYGVVIPGRSEGGQRLYSDADIHRLSLVAKAAHGRRPVGQLAGLSSDELTRLIDEDADRGRPREAPADALRAQTMHAVREMATERLQALLRRSLLSVGAPVFLEHVLSPLLVEIGDEWKSGRIGIAHEHAASSAIDQLLAWLLRELDLPGDGPRVVLATPVGERHGLGAMIAGAAAAHDGWRVTWLGPDLPAAQIAVAARSHGAHAVALSVVTSAPDSAPLDELSALRHALDAEVPVLVGGAAAQALAPTQGVTMVRDLAHWRALLRMHVPINQSSHA